MIFSWLKERHRRKLREQPFPTAWLEILHRNVAQFTVLSPEEQTRLQDAVRVFVAEKNWEGCNGLIVTDEMRVTIAGSACLLLLGLEHDYFSHVLSVLIYPNDYRAPSRQSLGTAVLEGEMGLHGQAIYGGPVILSWDRIEADIAHPWDGENLVIHEFAHQLDMLNREVDGTPPLGTRELAERWQRVMTAEFNQLIRDTRRGRATVLDPYGTTNEAEFFAVATETFFDAPVELSAEHPELYELLRDYYKQNPASRMSE